MAPVNLPYLNVFRLRGRPAAWYRRDGRRVRLLDETGRPVDPTNAVALTAAWQKAHDAHEAANQTAAAAGDARTVRSKSIADLIAKYRASPAWAEKADETKRDYEKALKPLEKDWGHLPVAGMQRYHVMNVRDRYAWREEPDPGQSGSMIKVPNARQANRVVTVLSILLTYAQDLGWRPDNPALRPKRLRAVGDGYRAWTQAELLQFLERAPADWQFAALLALLTAQRGQDLVEMRWADYDGTFIFVKQRKTKAKVSIEIHPDLKPELDARRAAARDRSPSPLTILARPDGTKWEVNAFQKAAGVAIREAGLTGIVWHGLRSTAASWAADGGATERMLQELLGHRTGKMSQHYARGANQKRMASGAVKAIILPTKGKSGLPNL